MSFLQSVLSLDKTIEGINSILPIVSLWSISQHFERMISIKTFVWIIFSEKNMHASYFALSTMPKKEQVSVPCILY